MKPPSRYGVQCYFDVFEVYCSLVINLCVSHSAGDNYASQIGLSDIYLSRIDRYFDILIPYFL